MPASSEPSSAPRNPDGTLNNEQEQHFTPEVEEFVKKFQGAGEGVDGAGSAKALSPEESLKRFRVSDGLEIEIVASEPVIRQPINMHFDERGRLWVVQYLQYPFPAGLKVVKYDRYRRATFDKVPLAPPNHTRGADKITILEDTSGDGQFDSHKDFLTGLNITSSAAVGRGGVWVLNPPYLLFYPDRNKDDVPDGAPEVHLSGFGLEDTHAIANSLHWGPDGWLYGAQGSTTTANVKGIKFLGQAIWRYHPITREFELFAEGGGNTWSVDSDNKGRLYSGTNYGATRGLHCVQGGYYVKGWSKHGPLTNPYAFGFFQHMAHTGYKPRFSSTLVIYEGGALPNYEGQIIAGMSLTNRVQASKLLKDTSSFKTVDTDAMVQTDSSWFRPVDTKDGPDGAVYIADWYGYDIRLPLFTPVDNWDKIHGRIYRLKARGAQPIKPFDLSRLTNEQLIEVLSHPNKWFREQARRLFADRRDKSAVPNLKKLVEDNRGQLALEGLWAVNLSGGFDDAFALRQLSHPDEYVRYWTVRLLGDAKKVSPEIQAKLVELARKESHVEVRSQLASSCKRLPAREAFPILQELLLRSEDVDDQHIPLLLWWAIENKATSDRDLLMKMLREKGVWESPLFSRFVISRLGRRYSAELGDQGFYTLSNAVYSEWQTNQTPERSHKNLNTCARLLKLAPGSEAVDQLIRGMEEGLRRTVVKSVPESLKTLVSELLAKRITPELVSLAVRLQNDRATDTALRLLANPQTPEAARLTLIAALVDRRTSSAVPVFLNLLKKTTSDSLRLGLLGALQDFDEPVIAETILELWPSMKAHVRGVAQSVLASRSAWARQVLEAVDRGAIQPDQISEASLIAIRSYNDPRSQELIEKHWNPSKREKQSLGKADLVLVQGKKQYQSRCGYCHLANGEGMQKSLVNSKWVLGPDRALIRIILQGKEGDGEMMPALGGEFDDQAIASILTYIRNDWGNHADPVDPKMVSEVRRDTASRDNAWTEAELLIFVH
ncbi:MAG: HEAT repeat domain-containing protein [Acidobacteria bacterium]|nr:HEAT repeat domain-containing protein [Acidobacteriota bacterium]MCI0717599.1 HEAT repeat domain-containing protein [Acidobacteriota bacterium]